MRTPEGRIGGLLGIHYGPSFLADFDQAITREWIITNGLGGYSSSSILNINTRKYHGLLVAALSPPVNRHLFLAKTNEEIRVNGEVHYLYSDEFRDVVYPDGYKRLIAFSLDPFPTFHYASSEFFLRKTVIVPYLRNAVIIHNEVLNNSERPAVMSIRPLVNSRHFYEVTNKDDGLLEFSSKTFSNGVILKTEPETKYLALSTTVGNFSSAEPVWIEKSYLRVDNSKGEDCLDDNYQLGFFTIDMEPRSSKSFYLVAAAGHTEEEVLGFCSALSREDAVQQVHSDELNRRYQLVNDFYRKNHELNLQRWLDWLILSADSFLVKRISVCRRSVIAGYHWFEDWGRDALISLPGLALIAGNFRDAEEILMAFGQYSRNGLIPIRFPDKEGDKPLYDSVDATLWFFNAVLQYLKYTGDFDFVRKDLWTTLRDLAEQHISGTMFGIKTDEDGLLAHGPRLTWMDASSNGVPITPREGKAVEIQALWYNALRTMELLATKFENAKESERFGFLAEKAKTSFNNKFWCAERDYLFDNVKGTESDSTLRPNQIIAVSLDFSMLDAPRSQKVVDVVWRNLWGTYGLKTISENDPRYVGKCIGGFDERDRAYHNGTVWPWLLGPFTTAFLKVKGYSEYWRKFAFERFLQPLFLEGTLCAGLGTLGEIFDGDYPHQPRGCISQAWSVAEPLRAFVEDVSMKQPRYKDLLLGIKF